MKTKSRNYPLVKAGTITKIEKQKRGKKYNLYLNEAFAFSIWEDTLIKFNLSSDRKLAEKEVKEVLKYDEKAKAVNSAYNLLGIRPRSKEELKQRLSQRYPPDVVKKTIQALEKKKLLSDSSFCYFWVDVANRKLKSQRQIRFELYQKKVPEEKIQKALAGITNKQELEKAKKIVDKVKNRYRNFSEFERKQKLQNLLARRGFRWEIIKEVVK